MPELTDEQIAAAETMPLDDLVKLATGPTDAASNTSIAKPADTQIEEIDNSGDADPETASADPDEDTEPEGTVYRREIINEDGTIDVYEGDSVDELIDKIAAAKRAAVTQMRTVLAEKKALEAKTVQVSADENYVVGQQLKDKPKETIESIVRQTLNRESAKIEESKAAQSRFVNTHEDYVANPDNGGRMVAEIQRLGYTEISNESLEKAYQSLKKSGLLILKQPEAQAVPETKGKDTQETPEPAPQVTVQRSQRSSTLSTRTSVRATRPVKTMPTEDEAYAMPLEKLRELANQQLANPQLSE